MRIRTKDLAALAVVAADGFGFDDIFSTFFGGNTRRRDPNAPRKGNDLQYSMTIDFMEAVFGKETEIEIPREETCDTCDGSGAKKGTSANNMYTLWWFRCKLALRKTRHLVKWSIVEHVIIVKEQVKSFLRNVQLVTEQVL